MDIIFLGFNMYKIVENKKTLQNNLTLKQAEQWLLYYLNHGHNAYIMEK